MSPVLITHSNEPFSELSMAAPRQRIPSPDLEPAAHPDSGSQPDPPPPEPGDYPDFSSESSGSRGPSPGPQVHLYDNGTALRTEISGLVQFDDAVNNFDRQFKKIIKDLSQLRSLALKQIGTGAQISASIGEAIALLENIGLKDELHGIRQIVLEARMAALEHNFRAEYDLEPWYPELASIEKALGKAELELDSELWIRLGKLKEKKLQSELGGETYARLQANRRWQEEQEQSKVGKGKIKCACCPAAATEGLTSEEVTGMIQGI